jgi:hypothetical protein
LCLVISFTRFRQSLRVSGKLHARGERQKKGNLHSGFRRNDERRPCFCEKKILRQLLA